MGFSFLNNNNLSKIHCIGIGGIGVSGLAEILHRSGYCVSGSDTNQSETTDRLQQLGINVCFSHCQSYVGDADCIIYTRAVAADNPEWLEAKRLGIPCFSRGEFLAEVVRTASNLVVAGSHGKSTTSGWAANTLLKAEDNASAYIGAVICGQGSSVIMGDAGRWVIEADESDGSCFLLSPTILVLTNVDHDHLENYDGSIEVLKQKLVTWINQLPPHGHLIACVDDPEVRSMLPNVTVPVLTYGFAPDADYRLLSVVQKGMHSELEWREADGVIHQQSMSLPGRHNALNGLAAWIACRLFSKVRDTALLSAWSCFAGVGRRMNVHGRLPLEGGEGLVIEDYGHHPKEIAVTIDAVRSAWPGQRVVMLFQPHRFSRTRDLFAEFVDVLSEVDELALLPIYAAGEKPDSAVTSEKLAAEIMQKTTCHPKLFADLTAAETQIRSLLQPNDILLVQGAGDVGTLAKRVAVSSE